MGDVIQGPWPERPADDDSDGETPAQAQPLSFKWRGPARPRSRRERSLEAQRAAEMTRHPAGKRRPSSAWADTPRPNVAGLRCPQCDRVFAAGFVPTTPDQLCRDCRVELELDRLDHTDPGLF